MLHFSISVLNQHLSIFNLIILKAYFIVFNYVMLCLSVCAYVYMSTYALRVQRRALGPLGLELQVVVTHTHEW